MAEELQSSISSTTSSSSSMPKMISFLSSLLQRVAESNDIQILSSKSAMTTTTTTTSVFHGLTPPTISIQSYLERIFKYANCSPCCFVVAYVYLDRFTQRHPFLLLNSFNVHRFLITSVLVAAKFMDDLYYNNAYYAKIGGISTTEMNFLEVDFLFGLGFHLNVTPNTFHTYCSYLQREMMLLHTPLNIVISDCNNSSLIMANKSVNTKTLIHSCLVDDEYDNNANSHQQQQQHQQLAV